MGCITYDGSKDILMLLIGPKVEKMVRTWSWDKSRDQNLKQKQERRDKRQERNGEKREKKTKKCGHFSKKNFFNYLRYIVEY